MIILKVSCKNKDFKITCDDHDIKTPTINSIEKDLTEGKHRLIVDMDTHLDAI